MTNLSEKLEQLSAAAMEAERIYGQGLNPGAPFGNWLRAQAAFSTALVNAFRTGQLVAVQADDAIERVKAENEALLIALHDAIRRPMGVVPASADPFYSPAMADQAEAIRALKSPKPPIL